MVEATILGPIQIMVTPTPLRHLLKPIYEDGVGKSKSVSVINKLMPLPNARKISTMDQMELMDLQRIRSVNIIQFLLNFWPITDTNVKESRMDL